MNSTDGYFDVTANRTKIVTVPDGYEVRLHKIGSSEDIFPDGLSTKDIKDLNNTLVVDLSTPGTIDLKGTLLSNGQPLPSMDGVDTEIDKKITALNLSGTYATKAALTTVETTANAAAPQSTTYTKTECDNKYAPKSTTYTKTEVDTSLNSKANSADVYTKTESDNKYATKTEVTAIKTTADAAAPQATTYTKDEINTSLSNTVKITGDQTIAGVKTFTDNIKVPSPIAINDAASKDYVDALMDSVSLFNPAEAQTITGAYDFQDGLTRTTKDSPSTTDIMNKEMSDNLYIPKTSNSDIGGIKTFTDGIILADEKQLQLGTGTDALKIHGTGTGKAVIEGTNASELDIAVPVNIQENAHISTLSTDVTGLGKTILFRFKNDTAFQDDMVLYMYGTTSLVGIQGSTLGGGFNVAKQGGVTCENSLLVRGGANFQSGVTLGQTLTVTGITTFLAVPQCSISPTATNQLTNKNYVDETIQQNINTTLEGVIKFASMTEAEYKALEVKSPSTIYYLTDVPLWVIGDQEIVTSNMPA